MSAAGRCARWAAALAVTGLGAGCGSDAADLGPSDPVEFFLQDPRIVESSGLASSRAHPGIFYTHNDGAGESQVFAVSSATGDTEAVLDIGSDAVDWEDIAVTDSGVWVGDIGGSEAERATVSVVVFPEPATLKDQTPEWTEY